jgi:uncharacterized protein (DUF697 family)
MSEHKKNHSKLANQVINNHVLWAMGAGAVPVPILDIAAVTMIQIDMLKQLCSTYDVPYTESQGKSIVTAISGSVLARFAASAVKGIPIIGSAIGGVSMIILSGASTYGIGKVFLNYFEMGKGLEDIDVEEGKKKYEEEFEKGKEYAVTLQKDNKSGNQAEVFKKLDKLKKLKDAGVLTDDEFNTKKEELLSKVN